MPATAGSPRTAPATPGATTGRIALAYPYGPYLRLESDAEPFGYLEGSAVATSPDGWSLAYWHRKIGGPDTNAELRVVDLRTGTERQLMSSKEDRAGQVLWRSDGGSIVVTTVAADLAYGGVDPPPAYIRLFVIDAGTGSVRELPRVERARFQPVAWSARTKIIAGAWLGEGGLAQVIRVREDGTRLPDVTPAEQYNDIVGSPDGETLVVTYVYGEGAKMFSGARAFTAESFARIGAKEFSDDPVLVHARYRGDRGDVLALLRIDTRPITTFALEIWPGDLSGAGRRVWSSGAKPNFYEGPIVRFDGAAAYLQFFEVGTTRNDWIRVDLDTGAEMPFAVNTRGVPSAISFRISDVAIEKLRIRVPTPSVGRDDAIARVSARGNVLRADRTEAKLVLYREAVGQSPDLTPDRLPQDAPLWAVAIAGDVKTSDGTKLAWGVWFVDGRTGDVVGFTGDPRPAAGTWPFFWDQLPDRR